LVKKISENVREKEKQPDELSKQPTHRQDGPTSRDGTRVTTFSERCGLIATFRSAINATTILLKDLSII
jgi:hypothetical protein